MTKHATAGDRAFQALVVTEGPDGRFERGIRQRRVDELPPGEVLVRVGWSSLNYKDALSATGHKGVTRRYPHTPGIDAAGVVAESTAPDIGPGDEVIVTSYDLGMNTPGGFGQYIRVPAAWVVPLPSGLTLRESMCLGTAGLTAGLAVETLRRDVAPADGEVLVTGATGGVGSLAVAILARLGYTVAAVTGKPAGAELLKGLGAAAVIDRQEAATEDDQPLLKTRWAGVVDTVGGPILGAAVRATRPGGVVTCCGMVAGTGLQLTVFPFILRGVTLAGIDSQGCPGARRQRVWEHLAGPWKPPSLDAICREVTLDGLDDAIDAILAGGVSGRVLVRHEPGA